MPVQRFDVKTKYFEGTCSHLKWMGCNKKPNAAKFTWRTFLWKLSPGNARHSETKRWINDRENGTWVADATAEKTHFLRRALGYSINVNASISIPFEFSAIHFTNGRCECVAMKTSAITWRMSKTFKWIAFLADKNERERNKSLMKMNDYHCDKLMRMQLDRAQFNLILFSCMDTNCVNNEMWAIWRFRFVSLGSLASCWFGRVVFFSSPWKKMPTIFCQMSNPFGWIEWGMGHAFLSHSSSFYTLLPFVWCIRL